MSNSPTDLKKEIKTRGYWEIVVRPQQFSRDAVDPSKLKETIINSSYPSRGWRYPLISTDPYEQEHAYATQDGIEGYVDFGRHREVWRFDTSGQFIHYLAFPEDWWEQEGNDWVPAAASQHPQGTALSTIGTVYLLTEILEFARRLSANVPQMETVCISITLHNVQNRELATFDSMRHLFGRYTCRIASFQLKAIEVTRDDLQGKARSLALELIKEVFTKFNWQNMPVKVFEEDQDKLLTGRL